VFIHVRYLDIVGTSQYWPDSTESDIRVAVVLGMHETHLKYGEYLYLSFK